MRDEKPDMSLSDRSKHIGKVWANLDATEKKVCGYRNLEGNFFLFH